MANRDTIAIDKQRKKAGHATLDGKVIIPARLRNSLGGNVAGHSAKVDAIIRRRDGTVLLLLTVKGVSRQIRLSLEDTEPFVPKRSMGSKRQM